MNPLDLLRFLSKPAKYVDSIFSGFEFGLLVWFGCLARAP